MKIELLQTPAATAETELLVIFAVNTNTSKDPEAKPEIALLASDKAFTGAAQLVLSSGEFKAEPSETVLLHAPQGLRAKRLLLVGLGKGTKATPHLLRRAAGTAVAPLLALASA